MRRTAALCAIAAAPVLGGACATTTAEPAVRTADMPGQLEPIHAAAFTRDTAVFWVSSNGCTSKGDVKPFLTRLRDSAIITLRRVDEDQCAQPRSDGVQLQWSFEELGLPPGAAVSVNNPYMMRQEDKPKEAS